MSTDALRYRRVTSLLRSSEIRISSRRAAFLAGGRRAAAGREARALGGRDSSRRQVLRELDALKAAGCRVIVRPESTTGEARGAGAVLADALERFRADGGR